MSVVFLACLISPAPARAAPDFSEFYSKLVEEKRVEDFPFSPAAGTPLTKDISSRDPGAKKLLALYAKHLPKGHYVWQATRLPPALAMVPGEPTGEFENAYLIWALKGQKRIAAFRAIDTTTGCNAGCTPVVFHLKFDVEGRATELIEEPGKPLRKLSHQTFSADDKRRALEIARTLPEGLANVEGPVDLTDEAKFPPQTWTPLKPMLVPNAAYTSYRIYEVALKSYQWISGRFNANSNDEGVAWVSALFAPASDQAARDAAAIKKVLSDSAAPMTLRRQAYHVVPAFLLWVVEAQPSPANTVEWAKTLLSDPAFSGPQVRRLCELKKQFTLSAPGRELLVKMHDDSAAWPQCPTDTEKLLAVIAAPGRFGKDHDFSVTPELIKGRPELIEAYANAAGSLGKADAEQRLLAELAVRFPYFRADTPKTTPQFLNDATKSYREELRRKLAFTREAFPNFSAGPLKFPLKGKEVYLFFASWCPHCQKTLSDIGKHKLPAELLAKLQLMEVFSRDDGSMGRKVCADSRLPKELCEGLAHMPNDPAVKQALERLSLFTVPRVIVVDPQGKIAVFDFEMDFSSGRDPLRDLVWLIEDNHS